MQTHGLSCPVFKAFLQEAPVMFDYLSPLSMAAGKPEYNPPPFRPSYTHGTCSRFAATVAVGHFSRLTVGHGRWMFACSLTRSYV